MEIGRLRALCWGLGTGDWIFSHLFLSTHHFSLYTLSMTTLLISAPAINHNKQGHPEHAGRVPAAMDLLEAQGVLQDVVLVEPQAATLAQLSAVHDAGLIEHVRRTSERGGGFLDGGDTYATADSYHLANLAAGSTCLAVDHIMTGKVDNGFVLCRPPGHHAEFERISGFCLFNNIAAAARHAQAAHGVKKVAIIDFDVHHGNGTQDIFYEDDSVLFVSMQLFQPFFYPGSGSAAEMGTGNGKGTTVNIPFPPLVGDVGYRLAFEQIVAPVVRRFEPELILVSAGYDAHWQDPLASAGLSLAGFDIMSRDLLQLAASNTVENRILFVLEGGYNLPVLAHGILNSVYALLGQDQMVDPFGKMMEAEQDIDFLLNDLRQRHLLN